jgi:hypothetical protein
MREAMARAEVGDEQIGDDPTVNLLCERVADLLGKEAAVFMPSGTMCNVAATLAHCRPAMKFWPMTARISSPRRRRACRARRIPDHAAAGRRRQFAPRNIPRRVAPALALPAAADRRQRRADRQYRWRHDLEEAALDEWCDRQGERACNPYGRRAAAERLRRHGISAQRHGRGLGFSLDRFLKEASARRSAA